jgi:hypothetical protein
MFRLLVEFSTKAELDLQRICQILGKTETEVIHKALGLLNYTVNEKEKGSKIVFENELEGTRKEIIKI